MTDHSNTAGAQAPAWTPSSGWPVKVAPMAHQLAPLAEAQDRPGHAWFLDAGAGKTYVTIVDAGRLWMAGKLDGMLVIAPNGPHQQWIDQQIPLHASFPFNAASNRFNKKAMKAFWARDAKSALGVFAMNYDALRTKDGQAAIEAFATKYPRFMLVIDESHRIKSHKAARTKLALQIAGAAAYVRLLSGTPILKGLEDLFTQFKAISDEALTIRDRFGNKTTFGSYWAYTNFFCVLQPIPGAPVGARKIAGYQNRDLHTAMIRPFSTRVGSDEFSPNLPPQFNQIHAPLEAGRQEKAYNDMAALLLSEIDHGLITAQNALVQLGRLMQIASGFLYLPDTEGQHEWLGDNKLDALSDLLETLDEPLIVWTPFRAVRERLGEMFPEATVYRKPEDLTTWDRILIANQSSGAGIGMNLQRAAVAIYTANTFASEHRWQSLKRIDRVGQTRQVRYWDLIAPGTVDGKVLARLTEKEDVAATTLNSLRGLLV